MSFLDEKMDNYRELGSKTILGSWINKYFFGASIGLLLATKFPGVNWEPVGLVVLVLTALIHIPFIKKLLE